MTVEGHTDLRGTDKFNQVLSEKRAASVKSALKIDGVDPARIVTVGYSAHRPLDPSVTPEAFAKNRRADFLFVQMKKSTAEKLKADLEVVVKKYQLSE